MLEIWVMEKMNWFMHSGRKQLAGMPVDAHAKSWQFPYACRVLPTERGEQTIVMSFSDVTMFAHASMRGVYKESMQEPQGCHLGFWN